MHVVLWWGSTELWAGRVKDDLDETSRRGPSASAAEIPMLAGLLEKTGWQPTPELSGAFRPGFIFQDSEHGHRLQIEDCFTAQATSSTYTSAEVVSRLQAGVGVELGAAAVRTGGQLVKKISFGAPVHWSIPALKLVPTKACVDTLLDAQDRGLDLETLYVVQEALTAEIAEQTCGQIDAGGRFVTLGSADVSLAMACAQESLDPVAVGYRTTPVLALPGLASASPVPRPVSPARPAPVPVRVPAPVPAPVPAKPSVSAPVSADEVTLARLERHLYLLPDAEANLKAEQGRLAAIALLEPLYRESVGDELIELSLRLADQYLQQGRYLDLAEKEGAEGWLKKAAGMCRILSAKDGSHERLDQALFIGGQALHSLGERSEALAQFKELVRRYPDSKYLSQAHVYFGEHSVEVASDLDAALTFYGKALSPDSPLHAYAMYKLGWVYHRKGERAMAIEAMQKLARHLEGADKTAANTYLGAAVRDALASF